MFCYIFCFVIDCYITKTYKQNKTLQHDSQATNISPICKKNAKIQKSEEIDTGTSKTIQHVKEDNNLFKTQRSEEFTAEKSKYIQHVKEGDNLYKVSSNNHITFCKTSREDYIESKISFTFVSKFAIINELLINKDSR